jgi:ABC-type multidrug transport system ATPase subunit
MELVITNLSKTYSNGIQALKNVNLNIPTGMFGLLGPNGSGKSTLMRTIAALQDADEGTITFGDIDVLNNKEGIRKVLGYLPQEFGLYPRVSAEVLLNHLAQLKGLTNATERRETVKMLLEQTNLYTFRKKNLGTFSGGMKQRFGIAQALLGTPKLIIVDEPTAGLDPAERNRFHNLLSEIGENIVVILSSHIIDDIQSLCKRMAIIHKGTVLMQGSPENVVNQIEGKIWKRIIDKQQLADFSESNVISHRLFSGKVEIHVYAEMNPGIGFEPVQASLEDLYFLTITNAQTESYV